MYEIFDVGALVQISAYVAPIVTSALQGLKQSKYWKNEWCKTRGFGVGVAVAVGGAVASGAIGEGNVDHKALYHAVSGGIVATATAMGLYNLQKPMGILTPGPDNYQDAKEQAS